MPPLAGAPHRSSGMRSLFSHCGWQRWRWRVPLTGQFGKPMGAFALCVDLPLRLSVRLNSISERENHAQIAGGDVTESGPNGQQWGASQLHRQHAVFRRDPQVCRRGRPSNIVNAAISVFAKRSLSPRLNRRWSIRSDRPQHRARARCSAGSAPGRPRSDARDCEKGRDWWPAITPRCRNRATGVRFDLVLSDNERGVRPLTRRRRES